MTDPYVTSVEEAAAYIRSTCKNFSPVVALTLGSGLSKLASIIEPVATIKYQDIPHFPLSTVPGHEGTLIAGYLEGVAMIGLKGRKHYYEVADAPRPMDIVTFPVHVMANLGCTLYIATNASGGLNHLFHVGDLMLIKSHIGFLQPNPLLGSHHDFGANAYFQPQNLEYDADLRSTFLSIDPSIREGVYVGITGRTYETQAECLMLRKIGADAVGMSTIPEIVIAHHRGLKTMGVSLISNVIAEDGTNATNHEEVMTVLNSAEMETKLKNTFRKFFASLK